MNLVSFNFSGWRFFLRNCDATVQGSYTLNRINAFTGITLAAVGNAVLVENCNGFRPATTAGLLGINAVSFGPIETTYILQQGLGSPRQYQLETPMTTVTWDPTGSSGTYPTLTATLPDGTLWSYQVLWAGTNANLGSFAIHGMQGGVELLRLVKTINSTSGLSGVVTVDLLVDPAIASPNLVTDQHLGLRVAYVNSSNNRSALDTTNGKLWNRAGATNLTAGSSSWTKNSFSTYIPLKLSCTLSALPAVNTEIEVSLVAYQAAPQSANAIFFVHPDPVLT
jgi:hypothetical protein